MTKDDQERRIRELEEQNARLRARIDANLSSRSNSMRKTGAAKAVPIRTVHTESRQTWSGFDLIIGRMYQEGFFRYTEPTDSRLPCPNCKADHSHLESATLYRIVKIYGKEVKQFRSVWACRQCLHEWTDHKPKIKRKEVE